MEEVKKREMQDRIVRESHLEEERKQVHREKLNKIEVERKTAVLSKIEKKNMMVEEVQRQKQEEVERRRREESEKRRIIEMEMVRIQQDKEREKELRL